MENLTLGSLFSGIGGFELGFERTGQIKTIWQVEIDEYCRRVLAKHWPAVQRFADIRDVGKENLPYADILCGGFPCQDISNAGKRAGIDGERSGLWSEYARVIRELRPRYIVVENVAALLGRGMERVLGDLAACGYDAEWQSIRASDVGAPHRRERIWIVAYPTRDLRGASGDDGRASPDGRNPILADAHMRRWFRQGSTATLETAHHQESDTSACECGRRSISDSAEPSREVLADPECDGRRESPEVFRARESQSAASRENIPDDDLQRFEKGQCAAAATSGRAIAYAADWWAVEPDVGRVAHGVPARVDRLRGLGNAIIPQIAEWIGYRIVADDFPSPCLRASKAAS